MPIYDGSEFMVWYMRGVYKAVRCIDRSHPMPRCLQEEPTTPLPESESYNYLPGWYKRRAELEELDRQKTPLWWMDFRLNLEVRARLAKELLDTRMQKKLAC